MTAANQQIITAYEDCKMSPEEIASDLGYELQAVKMILLNHSQAFSDKALSRANMLDNKQDEELFDKNDLNVAKNVIKELAVSSEIDNVRFKAAEFIINEKKGRNDLKNIAQTGFNITVIQQALAQARVAMKRAEAKVIEIQTVGSEGIAAPKFNKSTEPKAELVGQVA